MYTVFVFITYILVRFLLLSLSYILNLTMKLKQLSTYSYFIIQGLMKKYLN